MDRDILLSGNFILPELSFILKINSLLMGLIFSIFHLTKETRVLGHSTDTEVRAY
jgi:hypothetical protein